MKKQRVIVLMQEDFLPPETAEGVDEELIEYCKTEFDVVHTLRQIGHEVLQLGVRDELLPIRQAVEEWKPDIVFNLIEEFHERAVYDHNVVSYLELLGVPYTGCNPRGLVLARDKALSKKVLAYHRIPVPDFAVFRIGRRPRRPRRLQFPLIVKSINEEASLGISQASVVDSDEKLIERVRLVHERIHTDAIAESFIEGRELYVGVVGNQRLQVLPIWELIFDAKPDDMPLINTAKAKWDAEFQERWGVRHRQAEDVDEGLVRRIRRVSKRIFRLLDLSGYARLDYRLSSEGNLYFLEANPNPEIAEDEELACMALAAGISYDRLLQKILRLGLRRTRP